MVVRASRATVLRIARLLRGGKDARGGAGDDGGGCESRAVRAEGGGRGVRVQQRRQGAGPSVESEGRTDGRTDGEPGLYRHFKFVS